MPNMKHALGKHNSNIANQNSTPVPTPACNCKGGPTACPLGGACKTEEVVYKATVTRTDTNQSETYTGLTGGTFKARYNKHMYDFRTPSEENSTTLSKHIWSLKRENAPYDLSWEIISIQ